MNIQTFEMLIAMLTINLACLIAFGQETKSSSGADYIWSEAENPKEHTFPASKLCPDKQDLDKLSAGDWLATDKGAGATAKWEIQAPSAGTYNLWMRMWDKSGAFQWRLNDGDWQTCGKDFKFTEYKEFIPNRIVIHPLGWGFSWGMLGKVQLPAGKNVIEIKMSPECTNVAFDCWLLIKYQFIPFLNEKPDFKYNRAPEGWFPFEPDRDDFSNAQFDLRTLNETEAGSQGRIVAKGDDFVFEKTGKKVRFWGVCIGDEMMHMDQVDMDYLARRLAKVGVNLVRIHTAAMLQQDTERCIGAVHCLVAALKKQGIYSYLNWWCTASNNKGLCFYFDEVMFKEHYIKWPKLLLGSENPYTKMPLAKDPAVMAVELIDEDSIFWHGFKPRQSLWPEAWERLERMYYDWLKAKYGSIEKATAAWGPDTWPKGDDFEKQRAAMYPAYLLSSADWAPAQRNPKRAADQVEFMTAVERNWYADMKTWLRKELGYEGIVIGSNWQTADARLLDPLDQFANMAGDATAWNCYFGGSSNSESRVGPGQFYTDLSLLKSPLQGMLMHKRVSGRPHIMTEGDWPIPNRFRAEEPFLEACYGSLQGMNGWCIFSMQSDWLKKYIRRWPAQVPVQMGQFPAASIIYRNEYVKESPIVINDSLPLKDLYELKGAAFVPKFTGSVDFNAKPSAEMSPATVKADAGADPVKAALANADPLAYYVGKVVRTIGENPGKSSISPELGKCIDRTAKIVRSVTGEMTLDYGKGLSTVNASCAQGATGFLKDAGTITLADVSISMQNEYGTVLVVSLDGKPLKESAKILVQVMTEEQQYGYKTEPAKHTFRKDQGEVDCLKVVSTGEAPICVRKFAGTITLKRVDAGSLKLAALDANGRKVKDLPGGAGDKLNIDLLPDCIYYMIQK